LVWKRLVTGLADTVATIFFMVYGILCSCKCYCTFLALVYTCSTVNFFPHPLSLLFPILTNIQGTQLPHTSSCFAHCCQVSIRYAFFDLFRDAFIKHMISRELHRFVCRHFSNIYCCFAKRRDSAGTSGVLSPNDALDHQGCARPSTESKFAPARTYKGRKGDCYNMGIEEYWWDIPVLP